MMAPLFRFNSNYFVTPSFKRWNIDRVRCVVWFVSRNHSDKSSDRRGARNTVQKRLPNGLDAGPPRSQRSAIITSPSC